MQCWNEEDKATRVSQVPGCSGFGQVLSVQSQASVSLHLAAPKAAPSMERILGEQPEPGARRPPARHSLARPRVQSQDGDQAEAATVAALSLVLHASYRVCTRGNRPRSRAAECPESLPGSWHGCQLPAVHLGPVT